jgi:ATP-binding cassette, subfamily C, bacterial
MLEDGHLSIQGTPADLHQQAGVHLSFLPEVKELEFEERE